MNPNTKGTISKGVKTQSRKFKTNLEFFNHQTAEATQHFMPIMAGLMQLCVELGATKTEIRNATGLSITDSQVSNIINRYGERGAK